MIFNYDVSDLNNKKAEYRKFTDMAANTSADLLASLTSNASSIPLGSSVLQFGNSNNGARCTVLVNKINSNVASAIVSSPYSAIDGLFLSCASGTWSISKNVKAPFLSLGSSDNLNNLPVGEVVIGYFSGAPTNAPKNAAGAIFHYASSANYAVQLVLHVGSNGIHYRGKANGTWGSWSQIT